MDQIRFLSVALLNVGNHTNYKNNEVKLIFHAWEQSYYQHTIVADLIVNPVFTSLGEVELKSDHFHNSWGTQRAAAQGGGCCSCCCWNSGAAIGREVVEFPERDFRQFSLSLFLSPLSSFAIRPIVREKRNSTWSQTVDEEEEREERGRERKEREKGEERKEEAHQIFIEEGFL